MAEAILRRLMPSRIVSFSQTKTEGTPVPKPPCSEDVYDIVSSSMREMVKILQGASLGRGGQEWPKEAKRLCNSKSSSHTIAVVGRTGAGKSTAMNAVFRNHLLASSNEGACTSVITKIMHSESLNFVARVHFISRDAFRSELKLLLEDLIPSDVARDRNGGQTGESPAFRSKAKLFEIYPHLRTTSLLNLTVDKLLNDAVVAPFFSNPHPHEITAQDTAQLRENLRPFLTSNSDHVDEPRLWHLVHMVELFGNIDALSTGVTIVDLPGYGDANNARNTLAEEYVKTADCILLVADLKRAKDDRDIRKYFTDILKQLLVDGRAVDDGSIIFLLTGADIPSGDGEVTLCGDDKITVDAYTKKAHGLEEDLKPWEEAYLQACALLESGDGSLDIKVAIESLTREIDTQKKELEAIISSKDIIVARARSTNVSAHLQHFYREMYCSLADNQNAEPPPLPVFCAGSHDFLVLAGLWSGRPMVFKDEQQTGIPQLAQYIRNIGEHRSLTDANQALSDARNLLGLVNAHFRACAKKDDRLKKYEADTMFFQRALEADTKTMLELAKEAVDRELSQLETELEAAIQKAGDQSEYIFQSLVVLRWNVYSALMRRHGEWKERDLNDDLTKEIFLAVSPSWNIIMNERIPEIMKNLKLSICNRVQRTVDDICTRSRSCKTITDQILSASLSIGSEETMGKAHAACRQSVTVAQRDGTRFRTILQNEMKSHYDRVGAERGKGMFLRMKEENSKYILENRELLFAAISDHSASSFEEIRSALHMQMTAALEKNSCFSRRPACYKAGFSCPKPDEKRETAKVENPHGRE